MSEGVDDLSSEDDDVQYDLKELPNGKKIKRYLTQSEIEERAL